MLWNRAVAGQSRKLVGGVTRGGGSLAISYAPPLLPSISSTCSSCPFRIQQPQCTVGDSMLHCNAATRSTTFLLLATRQPRWLTKEQEYPSLI